MEAEPARHRHGGDYVIDESTPLWASDYGDTGTALTDVAYEGKGIVLVTTDISDYA